MAGWQTWNNLYTRNPHAQEGFSALMGAVAGGPEVNPASGAEFDPESELGYSVTPDAPLPYSSPTGTPVSESDVDKYGTGAVKPASFFKRLVAPGVASEIDNINLQPAIAQRDYQVQQQLGIQTAKKYLAYAKGVSPDSISDEEAAEAHAALGDTVSPDRVGSAERNIYGNVHGLPVTEGQTDVTRGQEMLNTAKASLNRQPVVEATSDAEASNSLAKATRLDPLIIRKAITDLTGELGREPVTQEILSRAQQLQQQQQDIESVTNRVGLSRAKNAESMVDLSNYADLAGTRRNIFQDLNVGLSPDSLTSGTIDPSSGSVKFGRNPMYVNPMQRANMMMGGGTSAVTNPTNGRTYNIPAPKPVISAGPPLTSGQFAQPQGTPVTPSTPTPSSNSVMAQNPAGGNLNSGLSQLDYVRAGINTQSGVNVEVNALQQKLADPATNAADRVNIQNRIAYLTRNAQSAPMSTQGGY